MDTNWDIFSCKDTDEVTDTITSYITFCENSVTETKVVKNFPNKSWMSKELKNCLKERRTAFLSGDAEQLQEKRRKLRGEIYKAKIDYKDKIEGKFLSGNVRRAWAG